MQESIFEFINACDFSAKSRVWKTSDLFTLLVEVHRALFKRDLSLDPTYVGQQLKTFYDKVDQYAKSRNPLAVQNMVSGSAEELSNISEYSKAATQATNDRGNRIKRGEIIQEIISGQWSLS